MNDGRTVWQYWEGPCPDWIQLCQHSAHRHARHVRLLTPETWDELWIEDRAINLAALGVEHRSDFIRIYLLAHYGGLWLDSDCVVLQSLEPLLDALPGIACVGYQEHYGHLTTALLGAPPGSPVLQKSYARMRDILLLNEPRRWTWAADTMREVWGQTYGYRLLPLECVQPVAWDHQEEFYAIRADSEHAKLVPDKAICAMMAYTACKVYEQSHPGAGLLHEGTFFRYLLRRSGSV